MTEFYRRAHDPGPLVAEMRRHGVEVVHITDLTLMEARGRVVSVTFSIALETLERRPSSATRLSSRRNVRCSTATASCQTTAATPSPPNVSTATVPSASADFPGRGAGHEA
jgi:hypothetical protein